MQSLRQTFEKELKLKLMQKSTAHIPEDTFLLKNFRYFDLNNTGFINPDQFSKTINKIGINFLTNEVFILEDIFSLFFRISAIYFRYMIWIKMERLITENLHQQYLLIHLKTPSIFDIYGILKLNQKKFTK